MRTWKLLILTAAVVPCMAPARATAQVDVKVRLGNAITVTGYSADAYGDWHKNYRHWAPVTLYEYNGHYYQHNVRGARAVQVYRTNGHYFFPPQDASWDHADKRYNYARKPNDDDYHRAGPPPSPRPH